MGNNMNCIKIKEKSSSTENNNDSSLRLIDSPSLQRSKKSSFGSFHYEEGLIITKINNAYNTYVESAGNLYEKNILISPIRHLSDPLKSNLNNKNNSFIISMIDISLHNFMEESNKIDSDTKFELYIEGKQLKKEYLTYLLNALSKLEKLNTLYLTLKNCQINDDVLIQIINQLKICSNLKKIHFNLSFNQLGYQSAKIFSNFVCNITPLETLIINLSYNPDLSGNGLEELAENICNIQNLKSFRLDLQATKISSSDLFFFELKESLTRMSNLLFLHINLAKNSLKSNIIEIFITGMKNLVYLQVLYLDFGHSLFKSENLYDLSSTLSEYKELTKITLILVGCELSLSSFEIIYMGLARLKKLSSVFLDFSKNSKSENNENFLVDYVNPENSFNNLNELIINLSYNNIKEINYENLSFLLLCLKNLNHLELNFNFVILNSKGIEQTLCGLANAHKLKKLNLSFYHCDIKNNLLNIIGISILHMENLENLELNLKNISITEIEIQKFLQNLNKLKFLKQIKIDISDRYLNENLQLKIIEGYKNMNLLMKLEIKMIEEKYLFSILGKFGQFLTKKKSIIHIIYVMVEKGVTKKNLLEILKKFY